MKDYLFKSERLGFRCWTLEDLPAFAAMNADPEVMEHFPNTLTREETAAFIERLQNHYSENGYCYFATEELESGEFIGFIGLAHIRYEASFTPAVDIGWRLKKAAWGKGYATEGAKRCLDLAFHDLQIDQIVATCTAGNQRSENVMKKIGMAKKMNFKHPALKEYPAYEDCFCYEIDSESWTAINAKGRA